MRYNYTQRTGHSNSIASGKPFDARFVVNCIDDLYDVTKFGGTNIFSDFRYEGMLVSIIGSQNGEDVSEENQTGEDQIGGNQTGVYLLVNYSRRNYPDGWKKISCDCNWKWPDPPDPYDPNYHYYLEYNDEGEPFWSKIEIHSGSGSGNGGYTTIPIPYHMLFEDEANGGLGLDRFGFLIPGTYNEQDIIPVHTPYDEIFKSILDGFQTKINGLPADESKVYNGNQQHPSYTISMSAPPGYELQYCVDSTTGTWNTFTNNSIIGRSIVGSNKWYFRIIDENNTVVVPPNPNLYARFEITPFVVIATSGSSSKPFDNTDLTYSSSLVQINGFGNRVILTPPTKVKDKWPGSIQNSFTLTLTDPTNLIQGTHSWGTLTIEPWVEYTYSPQSQNPPSCHTIHKDNPLSGYPAISGESNVYYVDGKSGLTSDGINHKFRLYVHCGQHIDMNNTWVFNDSTHGWDKVTNTGQWSGFTTSTQTDSYGTQTTVYTYSNVDSSSVEIPFDHIRLAFKVI